MTGWHIGARAQHAPSNADHSPSLTHLEGFVAKEVDLIKLLSHIPKAVRLVPALWECGVGVVTWLFNWALLMIPGGRSEKKAALPFPWDIQSQLAPLVICAGSLYLNQSTPILINAHPLNLGATTLTGQGHVHSYLWKHIKGNLTPDGIGEVQVCKLLLQYLEELCPEQVSHGSMWTREGSWDKECTAGQRVHHALAGHVLRHSPDAVLEVVNLKGVPLLLGAVASNGRYIQHAFTEFDEGATLYWQLDAWEGRRRLG